MDESCPSDLIDYLVSRFFCPDLEAIKVKMYFFNGDVKTNLVCRDMLEEIRLNTDYPSSSEEEESQEESEENESEEEDPI
jgi:hypothetical protein